MCDLVNQLVREIIQSQKCKEGRVDSIKKSVPLYKGVPEMASVGNQIPYPQTYSWDECQDKNTPSPAQCQTHAQVNVRFS
jgi:hypothetical protein